MVPLARITYISFLLASSVNPRFGADNHPTPGSADRPPYGILTDPIDTTVCTASVS